MRNLLIIGLFTFAFTVRSQDSLHLFTGITSSVTWDKILSGEDFDANIFPLVIQLHLGRVADIKATTLLNYHFGSESGVMDLGVELVSPFWFKYGGEEQVYPSGFYLGPLASIRRRLVNDKHILTFGGELGYMFPPKKKFTLTLMLQFGASYYDQYDGDDPWKQHVGFSLNLGWWDLFNSNRYLVF